MSMEDMKRTGEHGFFIVPQVVVENINKRNQIIWKCVFFTYLGLSECVYKLIQGCADITAKDNVGYTPVMISMSYCKLKVLT